MRDQRVTWPRVKPARMCFGKKRYSKSIVIGVLSVLVILYGGVFVISSTRLAAAELSFWQARQLYLQQSQTSNDDPAPSTILIDHQLWQDIKQDNMLASIKLIKQYANVKEV